MNIYEWNGKNTFMRWQMKSSIARGDSRVEWEIPSFTEWKHFYYCTSDAFIICFIFHENTTSVEPFIGEKISHDLIKSHFI
jgi:hypothetical protein